ncbi:MAG: glycosyltransferase, partial [Acidimicrobiales bacterium]|nr:glycosyltransferase [Acidimicrobiales bacterium]
GPAGRVWRAPIPGLAALDADLQPLRSQLGVSAKLRPVIARHVDQVDVVHVYTHNAGLLSTKILAGIPTVVSLDTTNALNAYRIPYRSPGPGTPFTVRLTKPIEKRVYDSADLIVANSEWSKRSLREDYGISASKIRAFPFGITPPPVLPRRPPGSSIRIGFLGRQFVRKGGSVLVDAFLSLGAQNATLVLISPDPLAAEAAAAHDRIEVIDDLSPGDDRLWELLAGLHIFAFPSSIDQAPNAVLEAMAAGLPVVGANVAAVPEMIDHGGTGLLVPPEDSLALAAALQELIKDPERAAQMGCWGAERFAANYTAAVGADRLIAVLREAVDLHGRRAS